MSNENKKPIRGQRAKLEVYDEASLLENENNIKDVTIDEKVIDKFCELDSTPSSSKEEIMSAINKCSETTSDSAHVIGETFKKMATSSKEKKCKVIGNYKNKVMLDFDGYGIQIENIFFDNDEKIPSEVIVKYIGEIGKENFVIL